MTTYDDLLQLLTNTLDAEHAASARMRLPPPLRATFDQIWHEADAQIFVCKTDREAFIQRRLRELTTA
jgi:hypothetical protein